MSGAPRRPPASGAKEPSLPRRPLGPVHEVEEHGALFAGPPQGTQVEQGYLNDCFFVAALSSLAQRRPEEVQDAIRARADGTFVVRLFDHDRATGTFGAREILVDGVLPEEHGAPLFAHMVSGRGLWVSLFEKAYARHRGGYGALDRGGDACTAIGALTGRPAHTSLIEHADPSALRERLGEAIAARRITLASTFSDEKQRALLRRKRDRGDAAARAYDPDTFTFSHRGLLADHQYAIWRLPDAGSIELRNPWASREPAGNGADDGLFSLPFDTFLILFADVTVGG